jgi:hypothetical protein
MAALTRARAATPAALGGLIILSVLLRTQRFGVGFWVDEGLSVGIADRPLGDILGVLRQDGSPPLYYLLLHVWMRVLGDRSEEATHALSLVLGTAAIPVAWGLARATFGERAGWCAAALFAANPFLTLYAQETRMYALVILLGTVAAGTFAGAFVFGKGRAWAAGFAISLLGLLYTHNWALFFAAATGVAWLVLARRDPAVRRLGAFTFGAVAAGYAPWLPTLAFQTAHTGAPWAQAPRLDDYVHIPDHMLGEPAFAVLAVAGAVAVPALRRDPRGRAALVLLASAVATATIPFLTSQASPTWATRYLAIALPPLLLAAAAALDRAGRTGVAALAVACLFSVFAAIPASKSNARAVTSAIAPSLRAGDLVVSTQPEWVPALNYYLGAVPGLRWASLFGPLSELGVTDWRDGVERMEKTSAARDLAPLLDSAPVGSRVALIEPEVYDIRRWKAPWTALVRVRSQQWRAWMLDDARFRVVAIRPEEFLGPAANPVRATVFLKVGMR